MYYKSDEIDMETIKKAEELTMTDYDIEGDFIKPEYLIELIEDLLIELDRANEKYEDLEKEIEDNYKPISVAEQYGIRDKDFI